MQTITDSLCKLRNLQFAQLFFVKIHTLSQLHLQFYKLIGSFLSKYTVCCL